MILDWLGDHYIEVIGTLSGFIYLYLEIKQNIWLWPVGVVSSGLYLYVFFVSKFYADMGLQVYYLMISFYGWYQWTKGSVGSAESELAVSRLSFKMGGALTVVCLLLFAFLAWVLKSFTDSPLPFWDAFTTALSVVATWMLTRKILEQWLAWVVVDLISLGLYFYKGLYPTALLFLVYTVMAVLGYWQWRKSYMQLAQPEMS